MTIQQMAQALALEPITVPESNREFFDVYVGDLLSWVMGRVKSDSVWITIMSNVNVLAVASLADVACVILAEGVTVDDDVRAIAEQKEINVFSSSKTAYELAVALSELLK